MPEHPYFAKNVRFFSFFKCEMSSVKYREKVKMHDILRKYFAHVLYAVNILFFFRVHMFPVLEF